MKEGGIVLIAGDPKVGKTVSAGTFPKKMLILDYDDGVKSIYNAKDKSGELIVSDTKDITTIVMLEQDIFDLTCKVDLKAPKAPEYTENAIKIFNKWNVLAKELGTDGCVTIDGVKVGPFETVVIDPLTQVFRIWKDAILNVNRCAALGIQHYGALEGMLYKQFIPTLKAINKKVPWVILTDHETCAMDESTGAILAEFPVGPSKPMGKQMSEAFDECWRQQRDGDKFVWRTKPHGRFTSCGSRSDLPDRMIATYAELCKHTSNGGGSGTTV